MRRAEIKVCIANANKQTNFLMENLQNFHTAFILEFLQSGDYTSEQIAEIVFEMKKNIMLCGKEAHHG